MYKIHELQEMSDEQLKTVADGIGFKNNNISDRDKFIYDLLDFQAEKGAAAATDRRKQEADDNKQPKKRGRKKKENTVENAPAPETAEAPKEQNAAESTSGQEEAPQVEKRRRGRPLSTRCRRAWG